MPARDQSRIPPGRSIRLTSSAVNGAYFARQAQKSLPSVSSEPACGRAIASIPSEPRKKVMLNLLLRVTPDRFSIVARAEIFQVRAGLVYRLVRCKRCLSLPKALDTCLFG